MIYSRIRFCIGRVVGSRCISRSSIKFNVVALSPKKLVETENSFAYRLLKNSERYKISTGRNILKVESTNLDVNLDEIQWKYITGNELCSLFARISLKAASEGSLISDSKYNDMCASISGRVPELKHLQLKALLAALTVWPMCESPREPNYYYVWKAVDTALVAKFKEYNAEKTFELVDLWFQLSLTRQSDFVYHALNRVARRPGRLKPEQVVLLLFYQNVLRTLSKNVKMFPVVERFGEVVNELSIEEIGIACMGFFKTENPIRLSGVVDTIISKLLKNADAVAEITLASILKAIRYELPISLWHRIPELMDTLGPQVDRLSITSAVHIPLVLTGSQTIHENILNAVSEKLIQEIDTCRLKDMEKVVYPLTLLWYEPKTSKCVFETVANQLNRPEREEEFIAWPRCLAAILHYLLFKGIFIDSLTDRVLSMDFIHSAYGKPRFRIGREILFIDASVELENPSYNGHRLPVDIRNYLSKRYSAFMPEPERKMSKQLAFEDEVMKTVQRIAGNECVRKYLLPNHSRSDIVVRLGANGDFLPLPSDFVSIENFTGPIRSPGTDYFALIPASRNILIRNRRDYFNGETVVKLRQLKILGFKPLIVHDDYWPKDCSDFLKEEHLKNLLRDYIAP